jgi:hypothetical protein
VSKAITGTAQLTYYHHEIAILASTALMLRVLRQPVLPYLDITVLAIGSVLAFGRAGCLLAGCCYGRPHRWGVCYHARHAAAGFPVYLVGVRLFPTQIVELLMVVAVVTVGAVHVLYGSPPGDALTWYVAVYGAGRFGLEFLRGDAGRRYVAGFSEAQWTSAVLMTGAVIAEFAGLLPYHARDAAAAAGVLAVMMAVAARRRLAGSAGHRLQGADHVKEVADALERACRPAQAASAIHVSRTSLGIQISGGRLNGAEHYALSSVDGAMSDEAAATMADLIVALRPQLSQPSLVRGGEGVFHLIAQPAAGSERHRSAASTSSA